MQQVNKFVSDNLKYLIGLIFLAGGLYVQNDYQTQEIERIKEAHTQDVKELKTERLTMGNRLQKKIKIISENTSEIIDLRMKVAVLEERENCR